MRLRLAVALSALFGMAVLTGSLAYAQTPAEARCAALKSIDFTALPDTAAQINRTEVVRVKPDLPESCQVHGVINKTIGFALAMPLANWNGKYFQTGCGGACGLTTLFFCDEPLNRGYACLGSDMGHTGTTGDWAWGANNTDGVANFGFRSTHVAAVAGKAIAAAFYKSAPKLSYFTGCSTGGRQALVEAQYFPWDFDGIIAGAPASNETGAAMQLLWSVLANRDKHGQEILDEKSVTILHEAVMQQCDADDGLKDGLIGDPRQCKFDPAVLKCTAGNANNPEKCLTQPQIEAARKIYAGPHTSSGLDLYTGGQMPGSELTWLGAYITHNGKPPLYLGFITEFWRHVGFSPAAGRDWKPEQFDFDQDYKRVGMMEPLFSASNPDLRKFKARGGKLIGFHGWDDNSIVPMNYLDYYKMTVSAMGGLAKTQDFFRLFMVPGMRHCSSDGVGADAINYVDYLEKWVERGQAPDVMLGSHVVREKPPTRSLIFPLTGQNISFERPHYPYPAQARYKGTGDPAKAASFKQVIGPE